MNGNGTVSAILSALILTITGAMPVDGIPASAARQSVPQVGVAPLETTLPAGGSAESQILVNDVTDFYGVQLRLTFDPAVVQVVDADPDEPGTQVALGDVFDGDQVYVARNRVADGVIDLAVTRRAPASPFDGSGALIAIHWQGQAAGQSALTLSGTLLARPDGFPIPHTVAHGSLTVSDAGPARGRVLLQGRADHGGTFVFMTGDPCPNQVNGADLNLDSNLNHWVPIPGVPATFTDAQGYFEIVPYPGQTYRCLQVIRGGYLVAQHSLPQGALGTVILPGGDVTQDDAIDIFDLALIAAHYGRDDLRVDVNADGRVDIRDLSVAAGNYGRSGPVREWQ